MGGTFAYEKYYYRLVYETRCGETDGTFESGGFVYEGQRTGDCSFTVNGGPFEP